MIPIRCTECKTTKVTSSAFHRGILPSGYSKYFSVVLDEDGDWALDAGSYAGLLPCEGDVVIQIDPKFDVSDLSYLLLRSGDIARWFERPNEREVPYQIARDDLSSFFEALVHTFLSRIDQVKRYGLLRREVVHSIQSSVIRGKIDMTGLRKTCTKANMLLPQRVRDYLISNPENRILAECLRFLSGWKLLTVGRSEVLKRLDYFEPLSRDKVTKSDLSEVRRVLTEGDVPSSRRYYLPALELATLILQRAGITLGTKDDVSFYPIMVNTYEIFERYIRNLCRDSLRPTPVVVLNGRDLSRWFYDRAYDRLLLKPDILLIQGGETLAALDVKYKTGPSASDHYQMAAYLDTYGLSRGAFVTATAEGGAGAVGEFQKSRRTVYDFSFNLKQIHASEARLQEFVTEKLVGGLRQIA